MAHKKGIWKSIDILFSSMLQIHFLFCKRISMVFQRQSICKSFENLKMFFFSMKIQYLSLRSSLSSRGRFLYDSA